MSVPTCKDLFWCDIEATSQHANMAKTLEIACIITTTNLVRKAKFHAVIHYDRGSLDSELSTWCATQHQKNGLLEDCYASKTSLVEVETLLLAFLSKYNHPSNAFGNSIHSPAPSIELPSSSSSQIVDNNTNTNPDHHETKDANDNNNTNVVNVVNDANDDEWPPLTDFTQPATAPATATATPAVKVVQPPRQKQTNANGGMGTTPATFRLCGSSPHFDRDCLKRQMPRVAALLHYQSIDVTSWLLPLSWWQTGINDNKPAQNGKTRHRAAEDIEDSLRLMQYYQSCILHMVKMSGGIHHNNSSPSLLPHHFNHHHHNQNAYHHNINNDVNNASNHNNNNNHPVHYPPTSPFLYPYGRHGMYIG